MQKQYLGAGVVVGSCKKIPGKLGNFYEFHFENEISPFNKRSVMKRIWQSLEFQNLVPGAAPGVARGSRSILTNNYWVFKSTLLCFLKLYKSLHPLHLAGLRKDLVRLVQRTQKILIYQKNEINIITKGSTKY